MQAATRWEKIVLLANYLAPLAGPLIAQYAKLQVMAIALSALMVPVLKRVYDESRGTVDENECAASDSIVHAEIETCSG